MKVVIGESNVSRECGYFGKGRGRAIMSRRRRGLRTNVKIKIINKYYRVELVLTQSAPRLKVSEDCEGLK